MKNYTAGIEKNNFWSSLLRNHPIITIITNFESVTDWNFWWKQFAAFFHSSVNGLPPHCVMWRCHCDDSKIVDIRSSLAVLKHTRHQVWLLIQLISVDFYLIENNSFCLSEKKIKTLIYFRTSNIVSRPMKSFWRYNLPLWVCCQI